MFKVSMVYWNVTMVFNVWLFKSVMMIVMRWSEVSVIMMSNNTISIVLWVNSPFTVVSSDSVVSISLVWPEDFVLYFISWVNHASSSLISCLSSVCLSNHMSEWFLLILQMVSLFTKIMFIVMITMMGFMWGNNQRSRMMFTNHSLSVLEITIMSKAEFVSITEMFWRSVSKLGLPFVMVCTMYSMIKWVAKFMVSNISGSSMWSNFMMRNCHIMVWLSIESMLNVVSFINIR